MLPVVSKGLFVIELSCRTFVDSAPVGDIGSIISFDPKISFV